MRHALIFRAGCCYCRVFRLVGVVLEAMNIKTEGHRPKFPLHQTHDKLITRGCAGGHIYGFGCLLLGFGLVAGVANVSARVTKQIKIWLCAGAQGTPHPPDICYANPTYFLYFQVTDTCFLRTRRENPRGNPRKPREPVVWGGVWGCIPAGLCPLYSQNSHLSTFFIFLLTQRLNTLKIEVCTKGNPHVRGVDTDMFDRFHTKLHRSPRYPWSIPYRRVV